VAADDAEVGEVVVSGDTVAQGYFRMPEESATAFRDGWMHTGDLATIDDGGYITIVDRQKDVIISAGSTSTPRGGGGAPPAPTVAQAAVIGIPHPRWGEAVHAVGRRPPVVEST
jgi:long-chain acyl-CoA synthetase